MFYSLGSTGSNLFGFKVIVAHQAVLEVHQATSTYLQVRCVVCKVELLVLAVDDDMSEAFHAQYGRISTLPGPALASMNVPRTLQVHKT